MYDQLLMALGHYAAICGDVMPGPNLVIWGMLFMSDWSRGIIDNAQFIESMGWIGVVTQDTFAGDYHKLAACMVENRYIP